MSKKCSARSGFYQKQGGGLPNQQLKMGARGGEGGGGGDGEGGDAGGGVKFGCRGAS